jgi:molybdate transport system substrate-binding protein
MAAINTSGLLFGIALACLSSVAQAGQTSVAVAANFLAPMRVIAQQFERDTGYKVSLAYGATGHFYAQIRNGAPFDILLAADAHIPAQLEKEGRGVTGSRFTYATGRLVLWSKTPGLVDLQAEILKSGRFEKLAIANPKLAPYGAAAVEVLKALGLTEKLAPKIVEGTSIGQAHQFVASGNATLGFVALSQVSENGRIKAGSGWIVPPTLYRPIRQDAVMLIHGKDNAAAHALMKYLRSDQAKATIQAFGYAL